MKKLPFQFYILPESVWLDERISFGAKFLLGILLRYCDDGYCIERPNKWYGEKMKVKEREVNYRMGELLRAGFIEKSRSEGRPNRVKINIGIWLKETPAQICTPAHPLQDSPAYDVHPIHLDNNINNNINNNNNNKPQASPSESVSSTKKSIEGSVGSERKREEEARVNRLIAKFAVLSPTYEVYFRNKTQRLSAARLLKKFSEAEIDERIEALRYFKGKPFLPSIHSPYELEMKWAKLTEFLEKNGY